MLYNIYHAEINVFLCIWFKLSVLKKWFTTCDGLVYDSQILFHEKLELLRELITLV